MNALYKRLVTMGMISLTSILAWIYCILEYRDKPLYIILISLVVIAAVFSMLNSYIGVRAKKDDNLKSYIQETVQESIARLNSNDNDEIERLNKATYVQIRKANSILTQISEDNANLSKQNMDSYIRTTEEMNNLIADSINKAVKVIVKYSQNNNGDMVNAVNSLSKGLDSISSEINKVKDEISSIEIKAPAPAIADIPTEAAIQTISEPEAAIQSINEPEAAAPVADDPNKMLSPDEIAAMFEASKEERRAKSDDDFKIYDHPEALDQGLVDALLSGMPEEESNETEASNEAAPIDDTYAVNEAAPIDDTYAVNEAAPIDEAYTVNEAAPIDDDPNKMLSPDEIAALIASMNG